MSDRISMAFFTPLPPAETGTADYAAALIPELEKLVDLQVFEKTPRGFDARRFDAVVYQIGNNPFHAGIYDTALKHPGIAVLHEPNLHDLIRGAAGGDSENYRREVAYEIFGAERRAAGYAPAGQQPRHFTMCRRLLDASRACIVHSVYAAGMVRMKGFRGRIETIPHGIGAAAADGVECRAQLGIGGEPRLIGVFGYLRPEKLIVECLRAFAMLAERMPDARLLIAGKPHAEVPVDALIAELGLSNKVIVRGQIPGEGLEAHIAACDLVLNLRRPTFGETSGIAARALGLGRTVILTDEGAAREYPDDVCVRIPCDELVVGVLRDTMAWLLSSPDVRQSIGGAAATWAAENCGWPSVAARYAGFARSYAEPAPARESAADMPVRRIAEYLRRWVEPGTDRARYLEDHEARLGRTLQLIPPGTPEDRILEMGCYLQITPALRNILGYGDVRGSYLGFGGNDLKMATARDGETFVCAIDLFDCESDTFPYPGGFFATVLCGELLEHLRRDPMRMLSEIHRVLREGGILVLTTPNVASLRSLNAVLDGNHPGFYNRYPEPRGNLPGDTKHEREYTPAEIAQLLEAGGFIVEHIETGPYGSTAPPTTELALRALASLGLSRELRGDCIFAVGRKGGMPRDPRPSWLYDTAAGGEGGTV